MATANIDLHVHPFDNSIVDVIGAMMGRNINMVGLEALDDSIYSRVVEETKKVFPKIKYDSAGIKFPNIGYILNAREYNTKEGFHKKIDDLREVIPRLASQDEIREVELADYIKQKKAFEPYTLFVKCFEGCISSLYQKRESQRRVASVIWARTIPRSRFSTNPSTEQSTMPRATVGIGMLLRERGRPALITERLPVRFVICQR